MTESVKQTTAFTGSATVRDYGRLRTTCCDRAVVANDYDAPGGGRFRLICQGCHHDAFTAEGV
jgi:hypothetical protein